MVKKCQRQFLYTKDGIKRNKNYKDTSDKELCVLNKNTRGNLSVGKLTDPKRIEQTGYKYLVHEKATSHTAFRTKKGFDNWTKERGLKKGKDLGIKGWSNLKGNYDEVSLAGNKKLLDEFGKKNNLKPIAVLSNGEYTRGYVEKKKGKNVIYHLNPNYDRAKLKYRRP